MEPDFQFTHFAPSTDPDRIFKAFKRLSCTLLCSASLFIHFELYKKSHSGHRLTKNILFLTYYMNFIIKIRRMSKNDLPLFWSTRLESSFAILRWILELSFFEWRFGVLFTMQTFLLKSPQTNLRKSDFWADWKNESFCQSFPEVFWSRENFLFLINKRWHWQLSRSWPFILFAILRTRVSSFLRLKQITQWNFYSE